MGRNILYLSCATRRTSTLSGITLEFTISITFTHGRQPWKHEDELLFIHVYNIPLGKFILILQNSGRGRLLPTSNTVQHELCSCKDLGHSYWSPTVRIHISWQKTDIILLFFFSSFTHGVTGLSSGSHTHPQLQKEKVIKLILVI